MPALDLRCGFHGAFVIWTKLGQNGVNGAKYSEIFHTWRPWSIWNITGIQTRRSEPWVPFSHRSWSFGRFRHRRRWALRRSKVLWGLLQPLTLLQSREFGSFTSSLVVICCYMLQCFIMRCGVWFIDLYVHILLPCSIPVSGVPPTTLVEAIQCLRIHSFRWMVKPAAFLG